MSGLYRYRDQLFPPTYIKNKKPPGRCIQGRDKKITLTNKGIRAATPSRLKLKVKQVVQDAHTRAVELSLARSCNQPLVVESDPPGFTIFSLSIITRGRQKNQSENKINRHKLTTQVNFSRAILSVTLTNNERDYESVSACLDQCSLPSPLQTRRITYNV